MRAAVSLGSIALAALAACTAAESQGGGDGQGVLTLESKLPASFAAVSNVVELEGKRVAFVDTRDKLFLAADLARLGGAECQQG